MEGFVMSSDAVRLGVLGAQHGHVPGKLRWLRDLDAIDLAGVYEPNESVRAANEQQPNATGVPYVEDIQTILEDTSVQGVVIGGAERQNPSYARRALQAGKHVLMEKACGWTHAHVDELTELAEQRALLFQMGFNNRLMPHFRRVFDMVAAGEFGEVFRVRAHMCGAYNPKSDTYVDGGAYFKGGIFYNLGCHALDLTMAVLGVPDHVHPFLRTERFRESGYVDNATVVLEYPSAIATIEVSHLETEQRRPRSFEVYGSDAQAIVSPWGTVGDRSAAVAIHTGGVEAGEAGWHVHGSGLHVPFLDDIKEFVGCIRGEQEPRFNYDHDRAVHHTLMNICGESDFDEECA